MGAEVESSNTVGYTKIALSAGYNLVGIQFTEMGDDKEVNNLGKCTSLPAFDQDDSVYDFQTTLRKWDGVGYDTYGWFGATDGTDVQGDASLNNKWVDVNTWDLPANAVTFFAGEGIWIYVPQSTEILVKGEVPNGNSISTDIAVGYNLIANPFPATLDLQSIVSTNGFAPFNQDDSVYDFQTTLRKWDGVGYDTYGWFGATDGTDVQGQASLNNKWVDVNTWELPEETVTFNVGEGFWIYSPVSTDVTIAK